MVLATPNPALAEQVNLDLKVLPVGEITGTLPDGRRCSATYRD